MTPTTRTLIAVALTCVCIQTAWPCRTQRLKWPCCSSSAAACQGWPCLPPSTVITWLRPRLVELKIWPGQRSGGSLKIREYDSNCHNVTTVKILRCRHFHSRMWTMRSTTSCPVLVQSMEWASGNQALELSIRCCFIHMHLEEIIQIF